VLDEDGSNMYEGMIENIEEVWNIDYNDLEFERLIGKGAFGEVHRGKYFGTDVAIKTIFDTDEDSMLYLQREINVLKSMRHPNIVQFIGITQNPAGLACIITEFVAKGDLRKKLKDQTIPMSWALKTDIAHQICCAIAYLHSRNIIHRDLKSKNLLVDHNWRIKVCDFGFARTAQKAARPMTICGTGEWMAPEIILGQAYSEKADVFSFGIVLCEIISRKKITTELQRSALDAFGLDVDKFLALVPDDCPLELQSIALECCVYEPNERPTFKQLIPRLGTLLKSLPSDEQQSVRMPKQATPATAKQPAPAQKAPTPAPVSTPARGAKTPNEASGSGRPAGTTTTAQKGGTQDYIASNAPKYTATITTKPAATTPAFNSSNNNGKPAGNTAKPAPTTASPVKQPTTNNTSNVNSNTSAVKTAPAQAGVPQTSVKGRSKPPPRPMTMFGVSPAKESGGPAPNQSGFYSYDVLKNNPPKNIDKGNLPNFLEPAEFPTVFGMTKEEYFAMPKWKQIAKKSEVGLF